MALLLAPYLHTALLRRRSSATSNDAAALLRRTTSSPCSSALLRVSFANHATSAPSISARFALSSTIETGLEANFSYKSTHSFLGFGGNQKVVKGKILNSSTLNVLYEVDGHWDRTIKVKDTNNRKARVIYDAKEVINGLQAPIVKDAEDSTFGIQEAENL
ncbi:hypothetical protein HN51_032714 [Arachis hypogaea]